MQLERIVFGFARSITKFFSSPYGFYSELSNKFIDSNLTTVM